MIKNCLQCGKEFESARDNKTTCSGTCRKAYSRSQNANKVMPGEEELPIEVIKEEVKEEPKEEPLYQKETRTGVSKRTGLSYDYSETFKGTSKKKCPGCGEPTWFPPCAACGDKRRAKDPNWFAKSRAEGKWGEVCSLEEWIQYPVMCENKAQARALQELYSKFTAKELSEAGVMPPKWKEKYATYEEAQEGLKGLMEEMDLVQDNNGYWGTTKVIDYSKWK